MVVTGRVGCGGDAGGGLGGGNDGGGGGDGRDVDRDIMSKWEDNLASVTLGT